MKKTVHYETQDWGGRPRRVAIVTCTCGCEIECTNSWSNGCDCGAEYNGSGQTLAPRHFWGEETGETF